MNVVLKHVDPSSVPTYRIGLIQARAYRSLSQKFATALKPFDLTISEWTVLGVLSEKEITTMGELTRILETKPSHPTVIIDKLQEKGLVIQASSGRDNRFKAVRLTGIGIEQLCEIEPRVRKEIAKHLRPIPRAKLEIYFEVLQAL